MATQPNAAYCIKTKSSHAEITEMNILCVCVQSVIRAIEQLSSMLLIFIFDFNLFRKNHVLNIKMALVSSAAVCTFVIAAATNAEHWWADSSYTHCQPATACTTIVIERIGAETVQARSIGVYKSHGFHHLIRIRKMAKIEFYQCAHIDNGRAMCIGYACAGMRILNHFWRAVFAQNDPALFSETTMCCVISDSIVFRHNTSGPHDNFVFVLFLSIAAVYAMAWWCVHGVWPWIKGKYQAHIQNGPKSIFK